MGDINAGITGENAAQVNTETAQPGGQGDDNKTTDRGAAQVDYAKLTPEQLIERIKQSDAKFTELTEREKHNKAKYDRRLNFARSGAVQVNTDGDEKALELQNKDGSTNAKALQKLEQGAISNYRAEELAQEIDDHYLETAGKFGIKEKDAVALLKRMAEHGWVTKINPSGKNDSIEAQIEMTENLIKGSVYDKAIEITGKLEFERGYREAFAKMGRTIPDGATIPEKAVTVNANVSGSPVVGQVQATMRQLAGLK